MSKVMYTIATQNRFAGLLSDDESDKDLGTTVITPGVPKTLVQRPEAKSKSNSVLATTTTKPSNSSHDDSKKKSKKEDKITSNNADTNTNDMKTRGQRNYQRNKNSRSDVRAKKNFDRHSGTGRGKEMKKSGACGFNWGNETLEFKKNNMIHDSSETQLLKQNNSEKENGGSETDNEKPNKDNIIDYTEYQKRQKLKREALLQNDRHSGASFESARLIDPKDLLNAGFEKYERENDGKIEKQKYNSETFEKFEESEEELPNRQKTININEFTKQHIKLKGKRDKKPSYDRKTAKTFNGHKKCDDSCFLNLQDTASFPSLA